MFIKYLYRASCALLLLTVAAQVYAKPSVTLSRVFEQQGQNMIVQVKVSLPVEDVAIPRLQAYVWFRPGNNYSDAKVLRHFDSSRKLFNFVDLKPGYVQITSFRIQLADLGPFDHFEHAEHFIMQINPVVAGSFDPVAQYGTVLLRNVGQGVWGATPCDCQYQPYYCSAWRPPAQCPGSPYTDVVKNCVAESCDGEYEECANNVGRVIKRQCLPNCNDVCDEYIQQHPIDAPKLACELRQWFIPSNRMCKIPPVPLEDNDLIGQDMDGDGIRDDIEIAIVRKTNNLSARISYATMGQAYQNILANPFDAATTSLASDIAAKEEDCLDQMTELGEDRGSQFLVPEILNNPARSQAYLNYLRATRGQVIKVAPPCN